MMSDVWCPKYDVRTKSEVWCPKAERCQKSDVGCRMLFIIFTQLRVDLFATMDEQFHQFLAVGIDALELFVVYVVVAMKEFNPV